jgi:hypothetical protein
MNLITEMRRLPSLARQKPKVKLHELLIHIHHLLSCILIDDSKMADLLVVLIYLKVRNLVYLALVGGVDEGV